MSEKQRIDDEALAKVVGGLGGENEATCPKCGKPMKPAGDFWHCDACKVDQFMSDADYIMTLKAAIAAGQTQGLVFPVWWDKVK
ncbi:MAG: hypothetical protein J5518_04705 [Lachnospiraceae bacterium]|nr:hypothetical protein [Lachnospiraceae bacterium]